MQKCDFVYYIIIHCIHRCQPERKRKIIGEEEGRARERERERECKSKSIHVFMHVQLSLCMCVRVFVCTCVCGCVSVWHAHLDNHSLFCSSSSQARACDACVKPEVSKTMQTLSTITVEVMCLDCWFWLDDARSPIHLQCVCVHVRVCVHVCVWGAH